MTCKSNCRSNIEQLFSSYDATQNRVTTHKHSLQVLPSPLFIFSTHLSALSFSLFFQLLIKFPPLQQQWESKASRIASVVAGCSTLPSRSHQGPPSAPRRSFFSHSLPAFLETAKVGPFSLGVNLVKTEGAAALFSGVSATTRMGLYEVPKNKWTDPESGKLSLTRKIAGGVVGAAVGKPASGREASINAAS
ncbi:hypothetical protein DY000_02027253 [Brassica cretica]|uniref:Uncharacterized protein n=1 Tax=Brassica cretica TaxID=69181 RepID=A0ABQ7E1D2_BRACR|nr:hypothetical protein DY000_02027253 [Brassica cretica]